MRIPRDLVEAFKFDSGSTAIIATKNGYNKIIIPGDSCVLMIGWNDPANEKCSFSIAVNRNMINHILNSSKSNPLFFRFVPYDGKLSILDPSKDVYTSQVGKTSYELTDPNQYDYLWAGLVVDQSSVTGSVCVDFRKFANAIHFLVGFVSCGKFGKYPIKMVNFQTVNDTKPFLIQAFKVCRNDIAAFDSHIICDVDFCMLNYIEGEAK